ncbi:MAG: Nif3-like dinuclear metal center hexameric protein [Saprospiraceae bacterium]|nr:Nif3-like dinuclear metal center hexameric protein [Saprospiraceae bacterium]
MKVQDVIQYLEEIAPLALQESYDNAGLQCGDPTWNVTAVLACLDSTEVVVDEAIMKGCNLIVAHHPIIFGGLKSITGHHYVERALIKAIKNDIAIYAIHTNLDNVLYHGVNERIAQQLTLQDVEILSPKMEGANDTSIGSGVMGMLSDDMATSDFLDYLKEKMALPIVRHTKIIKESVRKIGLCGGSGRFLLETAMHQGCDVFISADFKYHEFFEANDQILVADIGHFESERFTIDLLQSLIQGKFSKFAAYCANATTNPINYI